MYMKPEIIITGRGRGAGGMKITQQLLESIGFTKTKPCHVHGAPNCNWWFEPLQLEICDFNETGEWLWVEYDSIPMREFRHLTLLMQFLSFTCPSR